MPIDRNKLYDDPEEFFAPAGNAVIKLTPSAAISICKEAGLRRLVVLGVEGGNLREGKFAPDGACLWDGSENASEIDTVARNNEEAALFVEENQKEHNAFILTVARR